MSATRINVVMLDATGPFRCAVTILEGDDKTCHEATLQETDLRRLGDGAAAAVFVAAAFRFLLDREPKEEILARFDISVIARYFPDFDREIGRYLSARAEEQTRPDSDGCIIASRV